jgi:hypothetical protein
MNSGNKADSEKPQGFRSLADLELDPDNPRFGSTSGTKSQADILDLIVEKFGVEDVLSSLAVNGYFDAEPLVCRDLAGGKAVVVEGNRRLAACLIIEGDTRARHQTDRTRRYQEIWHEHKSPRIDPLPVIVFSEGETSVKLLSYLGVRHISAAQPWDSYAKAVWVSRVVNETALTIRDVALMIGDEYRTIGRMLEGYHFMQQLIDAGEFDPEASLRKGRGTLTAYPFSWVYTILGYSAARTFLHLDESNPEDIPTKKPWRAEDVPKAGLVVRAMFGDKNRGRNAAIEDSRELGSLAAAFANPEKVTLLEAGETLGDVERATAPMERRLQQGLSNVRTIQQDIVTGLVERGAPPRDVVEPLVSIATYNFRTARDIEQRLSRAAADTGEGIDG